MDEDNFDDLIAKVLESSSNEVNQQQFSAENLLNKPLDEIMSQDSDIVIQEDKNQWENNLKLSDNNKNNGQSFGNSSNTNAVNKSKQRKYSDTQENHQKSHSNNNLENKEKLSPKQKASKLLENFPDANDKNKSSGYLFEKLMKERGNSNKKDQIFKEDNQNINQLKDKIKNHSINKNNSSPDETQINNKKTKAIKRSKKYQTENENTHEEMKDVNKTNNIDNTRKNGEQKHFKESVIDSSDESNNEIEKMIEGKENQLSKSHKPVVAENNFYHQEEDNKSFHNAKNNSELSNILKKNSEASNNSKTKDFLQQITNNDKTNKSKTNQSKEFKNEQNTLSRSNSGQDLKPKIKKSGSISNRDSSDQPNSESDVSKKRSRSKDKEKQRKSNRSSSPGDNIKKQAKVIQQLEKTKNSEVETINKKQQKSKACEICAGTKNDTQMLLCDLCEDGFHIFCLDPPLASVPTENWQCSLCLTKSRVLQISLDQEQQMQTEDKGLISASQTKSDMLRKQTQNLLPRCDMCKQQFRDESQLEKVTLQISEEDCFKQAVCTDCKAQIGNFSLGNHMDAAQLSMFRYFNHQIGESLDEYKKLQDQYTRILSKPIPHKRPEKEGVLKLFVPLEDQAQFEVQVKSIRSVFMLQRLIWVNDLVYNDSDVYEEMKGGLSGNFNEDKFVNRPSNRYSMSSVEEPSAEYKAIMEVNPVQRAYNNPDRDCAGVQALSDYNKDIYARMRKLQSLGLFPPLMLRQHEKFGFQVEAMADIPIGTLICEYGGEVVTQRDINLITDSDSVMELIRATSSKNSLLIWPWRFANLAKFINGVNNQETDRRKKQNLSTIRCVIDNQVKVLLYTIKLVKKGNVLAFDYNAGGMDEYPTENFN